MKKIKSLRIFLLLPALIMLMSAGTEQRNPFPDVERYKLKNGLEVIFADYGELPVTNLTFFVNVGKKSETPGQQGLSELTANALSLGSEKYNRTDMDRELYKIGGDITSFSNKNFTVLSGEFLNHDIDKGMDIISSILLHPAFPQQDIDEEKNYVLSQNKPAKMDIAALAGMYGEYFTYGISHPLGRHFYASQYQHLTMAQIKEFYGFNFTPGNTKLVITGKPDHAKMRQLIETYFGSWTAAYGEVNGSAYDIPPIKSKEYAFIQKDGSMQAYMIWYKKAPAMGGKDVAAFNVANEIFSNLLEKEIREKDGYTYGIYSTFSETQNDGIFRTHTQVRNEVMYPTMIAYDKVLNDFYTQGATDVELRKFRNMLKVDILSIEDPGRFAALINPWVYRDYAKRQQYLTELDAIDIASLNKVIKKYFTPDSYKVMIAGDAAALGTQLSNIKNLQKLDPAVIEKDAQ